MLVAFATVLGILIVDQGLKFWVLTHLALGRQTELVPGFLNAHLYRIEAHLGLSCRELKACLSASAF